MIISLMIGKTKLTLNETTIVILEAERLMKQGLGDSSDGSALMMDVYDKKKKFAKKHNLNIKCFYCEELGHTQFMHVSESKRKLKGVKEEVLRLLKWLMMLFWFKKTRDRKKNGYLIRDVRITYVLGGSGSRPTRIVSER